VYWGDTGLACHLLGIQTQAELERSPFLGSIFEGFVAAEILKSQINRGQRKDSTIFAISRGWGGFSGSSANARFWLVEPRQASGAAVDGRADAVAGRRGRKRASRASWCIASRARGRPSRHWPGAEALTVERSARKSKRQNVVDPLKLRVNPASVA